MNQARRVRVWDLPTRVFHWSLVLMVVCAYATGKFGWLDMDWHFRFGYAILGLLVFRLCWGLFGGQHARFASFLRGPRAMLAYLRSDAPSAGHNPLGGWAVLALLTVLATQAVSGLFSSDDIFVFGPLASMVSGRTSAWLTDLHHVTETVLMGLIGLHLLAVILYLLVRRRNLTAAMISGYKPLADTADAWTVPAWRFWLLALASAALVYVAVTGLPRL